MSEVRWRPCCDCTE